MDLENGIIFLFFIVLILWTIRADFFLLIFVAAAYIYLLFIPLNYDITISPDTIMETINSVLFRLPFLFFFLIPIILYNIYLRMKKRKLECKDKN